jgi:uncharacterized delta-60 repeat protein
VFGATGQSYTLTAQDVGQTVRVDVGATNLAGSASATSGPTEVVRPYADGSAGALSSGFGTSGRLIVAGGGYIAGVARAGDGDLVVLSGVTSPSGQNQISLTRYTQDGTPDSTFGVDGSAVISPTEDPDNLGSTPSALTVLGDGSILVVGWAPDPATSYATTAVALYKFTPTGALDTSFGAGGVATTDIDNGNAMGLEVGQTPSGKFYVGAMVYEANFYNPGPVLLLYDADGTLDPTFGGGAPVIDGAADEFESLALASNGDPMIEGTASSGCFCTTLIRYDADTGAVDTSFGDDGQVSIGSPGDIDSQGRALEVENNGRILVGGYADDQRYLCTTWDSGAPRNDCFHDMALWAFAPDGAPDTSFGTNGLALAPVPNQSDFVIQNDSEADALVVQPDGEIVAVGQHQYMGTGNPETVVARFHSDGTIDSGWGTNGIVTLTPATPQQGSSGLGIDPALTSGGELVLGTNPWDNPSDSSTVTELQGGEGNASDMALAQQYAPELMYDSQEPYFADSVAEAVGDVRPDGNGGLYAPLLKDQDGNVLADPLFGQDSYAAQYGYQIQGQFALTLANLSAQYPTGSTAGAGDYIDEPDNYQPDGAYLHSLPGNAGQTYAHVVRADGSTWIEYWFYYYYNNGSFGVDDHEGDWEGIAVKLDADYAVEHVVFSEHSGASSCTLGQFQRSTDGGPVVYVANGSHASEPGPGFWTSDFPGIDDSVFPDASVIAPVVPTVNLISHAAPNWVDWPGKWGGSGNSPQGPAGPEHSARWADPETYASQAASCFSRQDSGTTGHARRGLTQRRSLTWRQAHALMPRAPHDLELADARLTPKRLSVAYHITPRASASLGSPRLLVRFYAPGAPPRFVLLRHIRHAGTITVEGRFGTRRRWAVSASLVWPGGRSAVEHARLLRASRG